MHQDLVYFPFRPAERICCAWTAMVPINRENGCLSVWPGSHRLEELKEHGYPNWGDEGGVNKAYWGIKEMPKEMKLVHLEMDPGDTVFFHPLLYHGSGENKSQNYRKAISCHYGSAKCNYISMKGKFQESLANEIVDYAKKSLKLGEINYEDIWRFKVKLVAG